MEDDQRLNTLVHEGDTLHFIIAGDHSNLSCAYIGSIAVLDNVHVFEL